MSTFTGNNVSSGNVIYASDHNTLVSLLAAILNGGIDNANINASAAINGSKLADTSIATAKLADSAVTPAKWTNPYKFSAKGSAGSTALTPNVYTKVPLNTELFDSNGNFDAATNYRYTAPVDGFYQINGIVRVDGTTDQALTQVSLYKNGSSIFVGDAAMTSGTSSQDKLSAVALLQLTAGDYIELWCISTGAGNMFPNSSALSGFLVSQT